MTPKPHTAPQKRSSDLEGKHFDCIIIGAGMSGLASGIRLALAGKNPLILERHNASGGLNSFYSIDGEKYDVGLHALTNYAPKGTKGAPLTKLLRQLRIPYEAFDLSEQLHSKIHFPDCTLSFNNDFKYFESQIAEAFPESIDGFRKLVAEIVQYDAFNLEKGSSATRSILQRHFKNPLLESMLLCPIMYYGSATENDMDFSQFVIMFRSLFLEGFARPFNGVRTLIKVLQDKYRSLGGIRKMRCGVAQILSKNQRAHTVILDDGTSIHSDQIISTAGYSETLQLCDDQPASQECQNNIGTMTFTETITLFDAQPADLGWEDTIIFFNRSPEFNYRSPRQQLVDPDSGVICFPNNYAYPEGAQLEHGILRITAQAHNQAWFELAEAEYQKEKTDWYERLQATALSVLPQHSESCQSMAQRTLAKDMFTPRTIKKYTGHLNGAIYGCPKKIKNGRTHLENLYIAGTDQGFLGIVGALLSGISITNKYCLTQ